MRLCVTSASIVWFLLAGSSAHGEDWPMFGRDATRNAVSREGQPPTDWNIGAFDRKTGAWNREKSRNIKWIAELGSLTYGDPVVAGGLVWIGTNNALVDPKNDASVLACFRESDGKLLYRYVSPRLPHGRVHDWPMGSLACSPLIEGDRLWFTTNRCETVCLDIGPLHRGDGEPRVVWKVDMLNDLGVFPRGAPMAMSHLCSPAGYKDWIYVITGNGVDETYVTVPKPDAPSLVCLEKQTGKVVWSDNSPGANILDGQWASPLVAEIEGVAQVIAPLGDGWVRSFDPTNGKILWEFDMNSKGAVWELGGRGNRNGLLASPVLYEGRVYIASGRNYVDGEGSGRLCCIDPTRRGDISSELVSDAKGNPALRRRIQAVDAKLGEKVVPNPNSGLVWEFTGAAGKDFLAQFHRTVSNVAIKDGLLIVPDCSGAVHCFDARTGKRHWSYDSLAVILASPVIVGDKVYVADEDGDVAILGLSADPNVAMRKLASGDAPLAEINMDSSVYCSPIYANGVVYVATSNRLFAIRDDGSQPTGYWPQWRGPERDNVSADSDLLQEWPEGGPPLVWRTDGIGQGIASIAIVGGTIYTVGSAGASEHVIALDEATGELRWSSPIGPAINDSPLMRWLSQRTPTVDDDRLYVSTFQGDLICLKTVDGQELWRKNYPQDYASPRRTWGFVDRPLVDGNKLICTPGGLDAAVVALDKRTGQVVWKCAVDATATGSYGAPIVSNGGSVRQYVTFLSTALIGIRAADGKLLWRYDRHADRVANSFTPLVSEDYVISPNGRGSGIAVLRLHRDNEGVRATEVQFTTAYLDGFQDSTVRLADSLFAAGNNGQLMCLDWLTGKTLWGPIRTEGRGKLAVAYADRRLYLRYADGNFLLAETSREAFRPRGKFTLPDHTYATGATFPVITGGRLYVRDNDHLLCYDVKANGAGKPTVPKLTKLDLAKPSPPIAITDRSLTKNKQPDAIFVPTPHDVVAKMLEVADVKKTDVVYDLGSGDGRIVIATAKAFGTKAVGIELDENLVRQSQDSVNKAGLGELVLIEHADIFTHDLSGADVIALYLPPKLMDRLLPQLGKLKPGARVVSHYFKFTDIPPQKSLRMDSSDDGDVHEVYLWTAPLIRPKP